MKVTQTFGAHLKGDEQRCFAAYGEDFFTCRFRVGRVCTAKDQAKPIERIDGIAPDWCPYPMEEQE